MPEKNEAIQGEINALKSLLADSDVKVLKTLEGLLSCTSATGIISYFKELAQDFKDLIQHRTEWREKINELEAQLLAPADAEPRADAGADAAPESVSTPEPEE